MQVPAVVYIALLSLMAGNSSRASTPKSGGQNSSFGEPQSLLLRPSTDWMRPTHFMEADLLCSKSTDNKCSSHLKNIFTATSRVIFDQTTGQP